jgi:hypothetical protein
MKRNRVAVVVVVVMLCVVLAGTAGAQANKPNVPAAAVGTAFTYQGQIKRNGALFTGTCDMQFKLWDASSAGLQQGSTLNVNAVSVNGGVFTVGLDFGNQFKGDARWLETAAKCADDAGFTTLPRAALNPAPYALGLMPGAQTLGNISGSAGIYRAVNLGPGAALVGLANSSTGTTYGVLGNAFSPNGYAILGYADGGATGVHGESDSTGPGVFGSSVAGEGVRGVSHNPNHGGVVGVNDAGGIAIYGEGNTGAGVVGVNTSGTWVGVYGESANQTAVWGKSTNASGVGGTSTGGIGVYGESTNYEGVRGVSHNANHGGVVGVNDAAGISVYGTTNAAHTYTNGAVVGQSTGDGGIGVIGRADVGNAWGVYGVSANGVGVYGATTTGFAGYFQGKVGIAGGSDLAELFDLSEQADPGTLMIIDAANPGHLTISTRAYDTKVAGIVSGAGGIRPGLTLHQEGVMEGDTEVAIAGRVYMKATSANGSIEPGDLLTTSDVAGHAMKAADPDRSHGAIIGKAMTGLQDGTGLVLVLVNLQ